MNKSVILEDWGLIDYKRAWDYQEVLFQELVQRKLQNPQQALPNYLLFCEHPSVYTLGKNGQMENLQLSPSEMKARKIDFYKINRGGDITYHGPGQWVIYPILDLENFAIGLRQYVYLLEEVIIQTLATYHIQGTRLDKAAGVWLEQKRKICATGVKASRMITMHGLAFNINTDLSYFDYIHPCGFKDKQTTSLARELGQSVRMAQVKEILLQQFEQVFGMEIYESAPSEDS